MKPILFNTEMVKAILDGRKTATRRVVKPRYLEGEAGFFVVTDKYTGEFRYIETYDEEEGGTDRRINPPYKPGDILYVRETFACDGFDGEEDVYVYRADVDECDRVVWGDIEKKEWAPSSDYRWHPSIHMPKEAARIFLRVTNVRVERLQEIDGLGAFNEGAVAQMPGACLPPKKPESYDKWSDTKKHDYLRSMATSTYIAKLEFANRLIEAFAALWDSTIKPADLSRDGWDANPWVWVIEFERCEKPEEELPESKKGGPTS